MQNDAYRMNFVNKKKKRRVVTEKQSDFWMDIKTSIIWRYRDGEWSGWYTSTVVFMKYQRDCSLDLESCFNSLISM